ncbi:hypothetical protein DSUL_100163 [Desulfovibrionales bacterium]
MFIVDDISETSKKILDGVIRGEIKTYFIDISVDVIRMAVEVECLRAVLF